jgi:hypothetical protein
MALEQRPRGAAHAVLVRSNDPTALLRWRGLFAHLRLTVTSFQDGDCTALSVRQSDAQRLGLFVEWAFDQSRLMDERIERAEPRNG